jgi:hypothetical protein
MITQDSVLVQLIRLVDRIPTSPPPPRRPRGRPVFYAERLFLKALVIMIVRRLHKVGELLAVLEEHTPEMREVRQLLFEGGRFPSRRTFERRLKALPDSLAEQIGRLGRHLVELLRSWESRGRAVALDSTTLRAKGGVWHKKDREAGIVPHTSIDTEAGWTKSGWHGWVYGWKLHLAIAVCGVWIPLSARLTPANTADNEMAPHLIEELPGEKPASCSETSTTTRPTSGRHAKAPSGSWSPPNEELTRTPMMVSKSDASSTSCAAWPTRTSTSISRPSF